MPEKELNMDEEFNVVSISRSSILGVFVEGSDVHKRTKLCVENLGDGDMVALACELQECVKKPFTDCLIRIIGRVRLLK